MRFLTAIFGKRSEPPPQVAASLAPIMSRMRTGAPQRLTGVQSQFEHFHRCLQRFPHLAPRDASVGAFVTWMQELGEAGEWDYADLLEEYRCICEMTGVEEMPGKWFWQGLRLHGCHRWQEDRATDGRRARRYRPWVIYLPLVATDRVTAGAVIPNGNITPFRGKKQVNCSRSGTRKIARQGWQGREGFKHSADISSAVAMR